MAAAVPARPPNPLTYPKADSPFSHALFKKPTAEYRACPFWAWNAKLDKEALIRQIGYLQEMGFGGFHMHVRTGLDTEYMGEEFMDVVKTCVDVAEKKGMMACLYVYHAARRLLTTLTSRCRYDEDRWPSGVAGGRVVEKNPDFKGQHVLFTTVPYGKGNKEACSPSGAAACRSENGYLLARYAIRLDPQDGTLRSSREINRVPDPWDPRECVAPDETIWIAYLESNPPSEWFNGQTYVDTLSSKAVRRFIDTTHEKYKECVGDSFGTTIPCIFTDEPQFATKTRLSDPFAKEDVFLPWTRDLPDTFHAKYYHGAVYAQGGGPLIARLPELFWNLPNGKPSLLRYRFHDHVCERFVSAFMDQLGGWCADNAILLNGHMMEEPTLESQTHSLGEAMRCYRNQSLPGIDLLADMVEYTTAKQASSVARQNGIRGCMSELYGCTHWYFTFEGHKGCGDWQAALGVTFRVPHLAWASMAGEAKRDYPASINYQSPWFREYGYVEDHFARVGVALTRGKAVTRVAVVHPVESFWLVYGPGNDRGDQMADRDQKFKELTHWLLHDLIDFDFISESLLPEQEVDVQGKKLVVGECAYEAVILPNLLTIRSTTLRILEKFVAAGGKVIVAGSAPELVDAQRTTSQASFLSSGSFDEVPWNRLDILRSVDHFRDLEIETASNFGHAETLLYQMRQDGEERFVFICNTNRDSAVDTLVYLCGKWKVELLDTLTGDSTWLETRLGDASEWSAFPFTNFNYRFEGCASVLLRLVPWKDKVSSMTPPQHMPTDPEEARREIPLTLYGVDLTEEGSKHAGLNVLMLDHARCRLRGDEDYSHVQEILALNNEILDRLGLPRKGAAWRQPWTIPPADREPRSHVCLEFQFISDFDVARPTYLALELPEGAYITLNTANVPCDREICSTSKANGDWFVDEAISTIPIPGNMIRYGKNSLRISFPFGMLTPIERVYILGDFKVDVAKNIPPGTHARAKIRPYDEPPVYWGDTTRQGLPSIDWGDITTQGLPFYVGNLTYQCSFSLIIRAKVVLSVPEFSSPVLKVEWGPHDNRKKGHIALQPRTLDLGILEIGRHSLTITAYGNRYNAFGHIHTPDWMTTCWPDAWRTQGWAWTEDYNVRPVGILSRPKALITELECDAETQTPSPTASVDLDWEFINRDPGAPPPSANHPESPDPGSPNHRPPTAAGSHSNRSSLDSWVRVSPPPESLVAMRSSNQLSDGDFFVELHLQVQGARRRLQELWDELEVPEGERRDFGPAFFDHLSVTSLGLVEREIARLRELKERA